MLGATVTESVHASSKSRAGTCRAIGGGLDYPPHMALLSDIEIQRELNSLAGWSRKGNEIAKTFQFDGFPAAISFVQNIVPVAEGMNHHPDVDIRYNRVIIRLSTHDQGGITKKDLMQARKIEELALAKPGR